VHPGGLLAVALNGPADVAPAVRRRAGLRIVDIAADAGFADVTHFHRVFRQAYGSTPAQLRRGRAG
jgi:AraC-like DNA-binding protein